MAKSPEVRAAVIAAVGANWVSAPKGSSSQVDIARQAFNAPPTRADVN